jgi:hypothetical protein
VRIQRNRARCGTCCVSAGYVKNTAIPIESIRTVSFCSCFALNLSSIPVLLMISRCSSGVNSSLRLTRGIFVIVMNNAN